MINPSLITLPALVSMLASKGYPPLSTSPNRLTLFGFRDEAIYKTTFVDYICAVFRDPIAGNILYKWEGDVDPSAYFSGIHCPTEIGVVSLKEGYYSQVWAPGYYKGSRALIQVKPMKAYLHLDADNLSKDVSCLPVVDVIPKRPYVDFARVYEVMSFDEYTGMYLINLIKNTNRIADANFLSNITRGSQVLRYGADHITLFNLVDIHFPIHGEITYCLFNECDLRGV